MGTYSSYSKLKVKAVSCVLCNAPHDLDYPSTTEMDHLLWLNLTPRWIKLDSVSAIATRYITPLSGDRSFCMLFVFAFKSQ